VTTQYLLVKFFHVLIAIVALGTSAGLGIVLEFYGNHPTHGSYVLRAIERIVAFVVIPGYVLMLVTGLWMASQAWTFTVKWIEAAFVLWAFGLAMLGASLASLRTQREFLATRGAASAPYRRAALLTRGLGAGAGLAVVAILFLMVVKPWT
jgi:uncharacterized membrane protein